MNKLKNIKEISLANFYDTEYADYAIYRALQRIPSILDGFAQTQRKIIYTCIDKNIDKKMKVSDLAAVVSLHTKYHHGSTSIETAISNLVPKYNNQIPLLREDGTYGSRSDRDASAPRYIETRLYKYSKIIFNDIDNDMFVEKQETEKQQIEPKFMIPIIPLLIINGQKQIGVGYATNILPRSQKTIIKILKDILTGKEKTIPTSISPHMPLFNGNIYTNKKGGWTFEGIIKPGPRGSYIISEVPPNYTRDSYMIILEKLKDDGKIKSYTENILGDDFDITVRFTNKPKDIPSAIKLLKLTSSVTETITVINTNNEIKQYNTIGEIFFEYIMFVLDIFRKRKDYIISKIEEENSINLNKIRFIKDVNKDVIILKKNKRINVINKLQELNYDLFDDSFEYLLRMRIDSLTDEKIIEFEEIIKKETEELNTIKNKTAAQMWLLDLENFEKQLKKGE